MAERSDGRTPRRAVERIGNRVGPRRALVSVLGIGVVVAGAFAFGFDRVYDAVTEADGVSGLDAPVLHAAILARSPVLDTIAMVLAVLFGGAVMPILTAIAAVVTSRVDRSWTPGILVVATALGSLLMTNVGKDVIGRHRPLRADALPPFETSPSFPSGHTLNATAIVGIVAYLLVLRIRARAGRILLVVAAVAVVVAVGLSRILLGAHWFTDVLSAWLLGVAWLAVVITAHRAYLLARGHPHGEGSAPVGAQESPSRRAD